MNQFYGIFRQYSFKQININNKKFKEFLVKSYDIAMNSIDKLAENIGTDCSAILPKEIVSFILNLLTTVPIHDRSTKLYSNFALIHQPLRDNMQIKWSDFKPKVNEDVFGHHHAKSVSATPDYAINLGRFFLSK